MRTARGGRSLVGLARTAIMAAAVAAATSAPAFAKCELRQAAALPVVNDAGSPLVRVKVNGHDTTMILDTGAAGSAVFKSAAKRFGFALLESERGGLSYGVGGASKPFITELGSLALGGVTMNHIQMAAIGERADYGDVLGLLGWDVLSRWDVEFDLAHHVVRLLAPETCQGDQIVYWADSYSKAPMEWNPVQNWIRTSVSLNGKTVDAILDSGADASVATPRAASSAGVKLSSKPLMTDFGVGAEAVPVWIPTFESFSFGGEAIRNAQIRISPLFDKDTYVETGSMLRHQVEQMPEMLVGADFLRSHRVLIATDQHTIYFTYGGGLVFNTGAREARQTAPSQGVAAQPGARPPAASTSPGG